MNEKEYLTAILGKAAEVILGKIIEGRKKKGIIQGQDINKIIQGHLKKRIRTLMYVNTIVLGNSRVLLDDIYIPLHIYYDEQNLYKIDNYPDNLYKNHSKVLIEDAAGMGKSTIMKKLFFSTITEGIGIPFLIELRRIKEDESIFDYVLKDLKIARGSSEEKAIQYLISSGGFVFFLDGYDEVSEQNKYHISDCIHSFVEDYSESNKFFLTSRPEMGLSEFGRFQNFRIKGLSVDESFDLIRKYDKSGTISELLIKNLKKPEFSSLSEFLKNPLLTSLLYRAFEYKNRIPIRKSQFYRQVYDANFESHDLTKGRAFYRIKKSGLDSEDFNRILRFIGYDCLRQQKVEFENKESLLALIADAKKFFNLDKFKPIDFLNDILESVPLFTRDGNYYRWCHRSIQEYFAALFIFLDCKEGQSQVLLNIYNHKSLRYYYNTLELYADIDPVSFRNIIELNFLEEYVSFYDSCQSKIPAGVSKKDFNTRIDLMFNNRIVLIQDSNTDLLVIPSDLTYDDAQVEEDKIIYNIRFSELIHVFETIKGEFHSSEPWIPQGIIRWPRYGLNTFVSSAAHAKVYIGELLINFGRRYISSVNDHEIEYFRIRIPIDKQNIIIPLNFEHSLCFNDKEEYKNVNRLLSKSLESYKFQIGQIRKEISEIKKSINKPSSMFNF